MPTPPIQQVTFVYVSNLEESDAFYQGILGFTLALDQGSCRIYQVTPTAFIGICTGKKVDDKQGVIITFVSDDLDSWHTHLVQHDVVIEKAPAFNEKYNISHLFCRDPDGYLVEIQFFHDPCWPSVTS